MSIPSDTQVDADHAARTASPSMENGLTICSASYGNGEYLDLNLKLASALNRSVDWRWVVVDNAADDAERVRLDDPRVEIVEGVPPDASYDPRLRGSFQHAAALNKARGEIGSRFALFLDPDFYLVRREWIAGVVEHMTEAGLAFFGVPWHPRWYTKYRYFPCVHCLFVDLDRVPPEALDFTPEISEETARELERGPRSRALTSLGLVLTLRDRRSIGASHDTGYRVYRRFQSDDAARFEAASPVFRPRLDLRRPRYASWRANRLLERFLPDERCFLPKRPASSTSSSFRDLGCPDALSQGWEEFVWRDEPFGFHVRLQRQDGAPDSASPERVSAFLERWSGRPA